MEPSTPKDHVYIIVTHQFPKFSYPGTYCWPIGMAYEAIATGRAKIDPRSAKEMDAFSKAILAKEQKLTAAREQAEREKSAKIRKLPQTKKAIEEAKAYGSAK